MEQKIIRAMNDAHLYEEVAYDIITLDNFLSDVGSGMIGDLEETLDEILFLGKLKSTFNLTVLKHTSLSGKMIKKVAVCGGAGSFLTHVAISNNADAYITSDIKYHEFFDAEELLLIDIGHYESEQFTIDLLYELLKEKYPNFAVLKTGLITNPVNYYI
jgi:putative NIF3 family GTP cyclohydrolase 1 type 2